MANFYRAYWDACAWIALINQEPTHHNTLRDIYEKAFCGELEIWTSTFTYAEVFKRNCGGSLPVGTSSMDDQKTIEMDKILDQDFIKRVNVDLMIGDGARKLLRKYPALNKPQDAIHVMTALYHNLDVMHTFDRADLLSFNNILDRRDGKKLRIEIPKYDKPLLEKL